MAHNCDPHQPRTLPQRLAVWAEDTPDAFAILAPGRSPLTYSQLWRHIEDTVQVLHAMGLRRLDRVALVLPNGPEIAVACLALTCGVTCVPLNPSYKANEFDFYLSELRVQALVIQVGMQSPARALARAHGLQIIELQPRLEAEAGCFTLAGIDSRDAGAAAYAQPNDVAFVMHTSGTTLQPKSVPLTHANVCASADHARIALALETTDRYLNVLPLFHVGGLISGLIASLMAGASVVCPPDFDASQFFDWLPAFHPTWYMGVSAIHQAILAHALPYREVIARCPLRFIRSPAAALSSKVLAELESMFNVPVLRSYGVTEAVLVSCNPLPPRPRKPDSVGVSAGPEIAIMDAPGHLLPANEAGEVVIRGPNVMQGYENNPLANRKAFRNGWFRTGDQGFLDADGYLFITGRLKEFINRGGETIAPQEVDDVFMGHPAVAQAVTFGVPHLRWEEDVMTAVILHQHNSATEEELRRFAATQLAPFKVPSQVIIVQAIPVGSTGKPQRYRLAEQFSLAMSSQQWQGLYMSNTAPRTSLEEVLAGLWATTLGVENVGVEDNFFLLGGDSLLAAQLLSRIRQVTDIEVSFHQLFDMPTVADIARYIAAAQRSIQRPSEPPLRSVPRGNPFPLSYAQRRLWFLEQLGLSGHAYNLLEMIRLCGPLQVEALAQSLQEIVGRHEVLRTTFINVAGQPFQVIGPVPRFPMSVVDLQELPHHEQETHIHSMAQTEVQQPFDLARGPLLRVSLVRFNDVEHVLLLARHHIVSDAWSQEVFWRELSVLYDCFVAGRRSPLPALPIQYADFAYWQQELLQGEALDTQIAYWKRQLAEVPSLQIPTDHPRPAVQSFLGARHSLTLSKTLTQALKTLSQRHGVTLFMTLLAAFKTLLHRYTGQDDMVVGSLIANRNRIEVEGLIGFFVNPVVLRTDLSGNPSFRELLKRVRKVTLEAYEHQDVPYEKLLEELRPPRDLSRSALFQVMCVLHNTPQPVPTLPGLTVYPLEIDPGTTRFDMTLEFWETPDGLRSCFEYSLDLFEMATIARMAGHLQTLLESMVDDPEQRLSYLPLLTADERRRVLVEWNPTTTSYPNNQCIQDVFESQVARTPTAVAVLCGDESLTYLELNCRANQVAHYLLALGVKRETPVGLCIERSCAMIVGLLGILKAGAAYVPLDPTYPPERLTFMLEDAKPPILLTQERCLAALSSQRVQMICLDTHWPAIEQYRDDNPIIEARADSLAYILYTSGSTGKPKGVLGVHGAVLNALTWMWQTYPFASTDVCCQKTSISFGDSIQELFGPLLRGIRVVLIPDEVCKDLVRFVDLLAWHRITRIILVPSLLRILLDTFRNLENQLPSLTLWFAGGEALSVDLCQRFQSLLPHSRLINLYGTSEASDDTTWYDTSSVASEKSYVPIGRPIANTQVYVLDYQLQPVPMGVPGELYVGGAGLARGYLNRPALTAERFIPHPFSCEPGARLFKTGDIVRYLADGNIEYIGRSDQQVKLLGVRIELGEIESALMQHPCIRETAVIVHEDASGELRLVAYVIPAQEPGPSLRELRHFLAKQLPASMVPTAFIMLDALPQTPSGKVDRQALPQPTLLRPSLEDRYVAPSTSNEKRVVAVWRQILGLERVGIHDNFFELGGHSLLAMQLLFRIRDATSVEIPLLRFFENPTVSSMVSIIEAANQPEQGVQVPVIGPVSRDGTLLASIAQEHFWLFDQVLPSLPLFNIPYTVRLRGVLNIAILEQSFNEIIKHHEALRTTFATENGQLIQVIAPKLSIFLPVSDLRAVPDARREDEAQRLVQEEGQRPFDLEHGSLLRGCLLRLGEQEHILLVVLHHIICDGWSLGVLMRALADVYDAFAAGQPSPLATLPIQYADFAAWQRQFHTNTQMQSQLTYWRAQLQEPVPVLALPTDYPQSTSLAFDTAHQNFKITATLFEALTDLSQREGCTLFMTCLAAVKILLYGYTSQEDLCIATLVANRTRPETEALIGLLVNTVLLRTDLSGNPSQREVLRRVRATTMAAFAHQDLPFEEVIRALEQERDFERASLCQVMVIWHNEMIPTDKLPQRAICFEAIEQNVGGPIAAPTTFDIILILRERTEGLTGTVICKTDLFKAETISRILDDFQYVLTCLHTQPEKTLATFHSLRQVCY